MFGIDAGSQLTVQVALVLAAVFHLAIVGVTAALFTASVAVDALGEPPIRAFAGAIARSARLSLLTISLLEVTASVVLVLARVRYAPFAQTGGYWAGVLLPLAAGLTLLGVFQSALASDRWPPLRPAIGLAGIGLAVGSCFVLMSGAGALLQPEAWPTNEPFYRFLLTWSGTGRFTELTLLSFAATGVLVAAAGERQGDAAVVRFARRFGAGTTLVSLIAWPLALLFTHFNLPSIALSAAVWAFAATGIVLAGGMAWAVSSVLGGGVALRHRPLAAAALALFGTLVAGDHLAREQAIQPATIAGVTGPAAAAPAPRPAPQPPSAPSGRVAAGKAVFDRVCSICHRFDVKLVGPPFNSTVPKYRKDPEALKAYIRNPVKRNPAFPAMPKPAVSEQELDAVAAYLLEKAAP